MSYWIGIIGCWLLSDGCYSIMLYLSAPGHSGKKQTWLRDHSVRVLRIILAIILIIIGWLLSNG